MAFVLVFLAGALAHEPAQRCEPADCFALLAARASVAPSPLPLEELVGKWSDAGGLSGHVLYLFPDRTYIFTEWADVMAETLGDRGHWEAAGDLLTMSPDPDLVDSKYRDRRFLMLSHPSYSQPLLIGLDRSLANYVLLTDEKPDVGTGDDWLVAFYFVRRETLNAGDIDRIKGRLGGGAQ